MKTSVRKEWFSFRVIFRFIIVNTCFLPNVGAVSAFYGSEGYFADWGSLGGRSNHPTCVDIPKSMALCQNIGYSKMRLPNLLDHDTMTEASSQSASWIPLLNVNCHPDTQLFLCSLFSPVCVDRPIYPCRSLCDKVKSGCEQRMKSHGFPWPEMLRCDKFPVDNDLCIMAQSSNNNSHNTNAAAAPVAVCGACNQVETYENILDNFCRADFAVKTKIKKIKKSKIICKRSKILKGNMDRKLQRLIRRPVFTLDNLEECGCHSATKAGRDSYLIMGSKRGEDLLPTFIMEWQSDSAPFRNAVKMFKTINCADPKVVSEYLGDSSLKLNSPSASVQRFSTKTRSVEGLGSVPVTDHPVAPPMIELSEHVDIETQPPEPTENSRKGNTANRNKPSRRRKDRPTSTLRPSLLAEDILT